MFHSPLKVPRPHLFEYIDAINTAPYITVVHIDQNIHDQAWQLLKNRPDKNWSLVNATSFIIMKEWKLSLALTSDHHLTQAGFITILKKDN